MCVCVRAYIEKSLCACSLSVGQKSAVVSIQKGSVLKMLFFMDAAMKSPTYKENDTCISQLLVHFMEDVEIGGMWCQVAC